MAYLYSFLLLGGICLTAELIYEFTKLTPGHITSIYVLIGILLESFGIYDFLIQNAPGGALLSITSFGHLLAHSVIEAIKVEGFMGILSAMFIPASASLTTVIVLSVLTSAIFKPKI